MLLLPLFGAIAIETLMEREGSKYEDEDEDEDKVLVLY